MAKGIHEERYRRLIGSLIERRRALGLNQTVVATRLGKRQQYVSKYESGERRLDIVEFIDIARALGVDPAELIKTVSPAVSDTGSASPAA